MKKVFLTAVLALGLMGVTNASEVDVLALVTKGKVNENSAGVEVLTLDEKKEIVGGYRPFSASWYSYTFIQMPLTNNYNANINNQSNSHMSNAFMQTYKPPRFPVYFRKR